ncbi:MAG: toast rack family protein [Thermomicrobiales bacterium]|nr:toast rack family protein [Thermomicrobiales bacterium]
MIFGRSKNVAEQFAHHTLPTGTADHVVARVGMHVGVLRISGSASDLLDGAFRYTPELEPVLNYEETDGTGRMTVCQSTPSGRSSNRGRNEWDIALSNRIPLDLEIVHSTGDGTYNLSALALRNVSIDQATGESTLTIAGRQDNLRQVRIEGSTGTIGLQLTGQFAALATVDVSASTGSLDVDLRGIWESDCAVRLQAATGSIRVRLPDAVGLEVRATTSLGAIRAHGLHGQPGNWSRPAADGMPIMRLDLSTGVGSLTIEADTR